MPRGLEEIAVRIGRIWYHDRVRRMAFSETVPGGEVGRVGCQDFAVLTAGVLPALLVHRLLRQEQSAVDTPEFTQHLTRAAGDQRQVAPGLRRGIRAPEGHLAEPEVNMGERRTGPV